MAPRPTFERPPSGLDSYWTHVWEHALRLSKEQGTWGAEIKPLLDEYVFALRAAQATRDGFAWLAALERYAEDAEDLPEIAWTTLGQIAGGLPTQWDRHAKRAAALADQLALTARGRKAIGLASDDEDRPPEDPFSEVDELAPRREARTS
jgi:hypothetical protein